ncbi:MAG: MFS transporter [Chloroflexota bacterium]|nr:MFS transporter [Chloroflexota bacterium]
MVLFYGWWVVFASAGIVFLTGGTFFYGFSALVNPLTREFGWSRALISGAFSLRTEVGGLAAPVAGYLVDRVGSRRLLIAGVLLVGAGFLFLSRVHSVWTFYAAVMVIAVGMSATGGPVAMAAVAHWFVKKRGRALALMTTGAGSSGVMVVVLAWLISQFDWRTALVIMGLVQWAVCIPLALLVWSRPEDRGLLPDGERPALSLSKGPAVAAGSWPDQDERSAVPEAAAVGDGFPRPQDEGLSMGQAVRTRSFWLLATAMALAGLGSTAIIVHQIPFFTEAAGLSEQRAALVAMAMTFVSLAGRLGFGWLADYVDKRRVLAAAYVLMALGIIVLANAHSGWQLLFFLAVFSPGWGGVIAVRPAFQVECFGLRAFGGIQGLMFTVSTLGSVVGPVFAGWMHDTADTYRPAFMILAMAVLAAAPAVLMMGKPRTEWAEVARAPEL